MTNLNVNGFSRAKFRVLDARTNVCIIPVFGLSFDAADSVHCYVNDCGMENFARSKCIHCFNAFTVIVSHLCAIATF